MHLKEQILLKQFIDEALRVTIQKVNDVGDVIGGYSKQLDGDEADELEWYVDKYGRDPISYRKKKTGEEPKASDVDPSEINARKLVSQLAPSGRESDLFDVIKPWGQVGFDALRRILVSVDNTGVAFPFFSVKNVSAGSVIPFPTYPSSGLLDFLYDVRVRIGRNATGRGEFLLALLTGGIAGGDVGDLQIGGKNWEVKDGQLGSPVRLGGVASREFDTVVAEQFTDSKDLTDLFNKLTSRSAYSTLPEKQRELVDAATKTAVSSGGLAGYILTSKSEFIVRSPGSAVFEVRAKNGRLHVTFPK